MITIFEGPDGSGKTTLIDEMVRSKALSTREVVHHGAYPGVADVYSRYLASMLRPRKAILDRSWLAEPIYGEVHRGGENRVDVAHRRMLERYALGQRAVCVLMMPPVERCLNTFRSRKDREYLDNESELRAVWHGYSMMITALPTVIYDYTSMSPRDVLDTILAARPRPAHDDGVGHWNPGEVTLMVGDRRNDDDPRRDHLVFMNGVAANAGCGPWLARELEHIGISERDLYWVNASSCDGDDHSPEFIGELHPKRVIALGKEAERWCRTIARVECVVVDHPQYRKRFFHHEPWRDLRRALTA